MKLTCCKLGVVHLPVVGAAALVQPRVHGRAAVAQRAGAAAHGRVRSVKVLRTLETLMIIPIRVQPAVAILPLCIRYPQIPGQISQQQAVQQAHHPGKPLRFTVPCVLWAAAPGHRLSVRVRDSSLRLIYYREVVEDVKLCHLSKIQTAQPNAAKPQCGKILN